MSSANVHRVVSGWPPLPSQSRRCLKGADETRRMIRVVNLNMQFPGLLLTPELEWGTFIKFFCKWSGLWTAAVEEMGDRCPVNDVRRSVVIAWPLWLSGLLINYRSARRIGLQGSLRIWIDPFTHKIDLRELTVTKRWMCCLHLGQCTRIDLVVLTVNMTTTMGVFRRFTSFKSTKMIPLLL